MVASTNLELAKRSFAEAGALYTFAGDDIIRLEGYTSHEEAREAAGFG